MYWLLPTSRELAARASSCRRVSTGHYAGVQYDTFHHFHYQALQNT
jgi:hypothetical protein